MKSPRRQRPLTIPANVTFRLPASCNDLALRATPSAQQRRGVDHQPTPIKRNSALLTHRAASGPKKANRACRCGAFQGSGYATEAARALVGWPKVQRQPNRVYLPVAGMGLDFGGFGKEYAVDIVAQIAAHAGIPDVLVDFGHDIRVMGAPPGRPAWHVGLEDPARPGTAWGMASVAAPGAGEGDAVS